MLRYFLQEILLQNPRIGQLKIYVSGLKGSCVCANSLKLCSVWYVYKCAVISVAVIVLHAGCVNKNSF